MVPLILNAAPLATITHLVQAPCVMNRILIVDDHDLSRHAIQAVLEFHGYCCEEADNGRAAQIWLRHNQVDLVITDNKMPGLGGLELLEHLRETTKYHVLPVIMLSGNLTESEKKKAYGLGVCAVLDKPCDFHVLLTTITRALKRI
jgi:DNA-binding response OmpR family regulator